MKIYLINWSFYSCNGGGAPEITAIYSTYELALNHIQNEIRERNLKQEKHSVSGELLDCWTDGDYWTSIGVVYMDSPGLYVSKEEWEKL